MTRRVFGPNIKRFKTEVIPAMEKGIHVVLSAIRDSGPVGGMVTIVKKSSAVWPKK